MMSRHIQGNGQKAVWKGLAIGWTASMLVTVVLAAVIAMLISMEKVGEEALATASVLVLLAASFTGAVFSTALIGNRKLIFALVSGFLYYLSLVCCNALLLEGRYQGLGAAALSVAGSSLVAGLTGFRQKKQKYRHPKGLK